MRFFLIILAIVIVTMVGLFIYGQTVEAPTRVIEQEAITSDG